MSCIHYKFKTSLDYRSISFDGVALSLADLKKSIFQQKRMKTGEFDLEITNAQTKEVYKNNDDMIPKNSSVIVARVPIPTSTKNSTSKSWEAFKQECARAIKEEQEKAAQEAATQAAGDLTNAKFSEIDKIKAMMNQATRDFDPLNYKNKVPLGPPPANYRCYKCGKGGHYIQSCTVEKSEGNMLEPNRFKRSTGIPNSFLTLTNDPTAQGALLTYSGKFAVPTIDAQAYLTGKKERPPFLPGNNDESAVTPLTKIIPQELLCLVCKDLLRDAVLIPCCGNSFCDECIRNRLLETEDHECPFCHEQDVSPDKLIANMQMRRAITNFLNETGYSQVKNRNIEHLKEERRSSSPTEPPKIMQSSTQPPLQRHQPAQPQTPLTTRDAWRQYNQRKHPASSSVSAQSIQTVPHSQTPPQQAHQSHELQHMQPLHPQQMHPTHHQGHPALQPQTVPQHVHAPHSVHLPPQGHAGYQPVHEAPQSVHPIPQSVHPVPQSVHPIPQSVHPVPQSVHPVPQSLHQVPQSRHPIPQSVHPIPQSLHPIPQSLHPIPQSVHPAPHHIQPTIQQVHVPPHAVNHPLHTAMESQHVPTQLPQQIIPRTEHVTYASPGHLNQVPSVNTSSFSQQLENRSPEERAPTPVKDEQPLPPGVDDHMGSVISVVGQPSSDALRGGQPPSSGNVPSWKGNTNPPSSVIPAFTSVPPGIGISHPQPLFGHPPGYPVPVVGTPIYGPPFVPGGTVPPFAPGGPASLPMSKEEFYREQKRMKEFVMEKKYDVMDHFTKDFLERKERVKPKSKTRSRSRSLSKSSRRTRSPRRSISRTPRRSLTPIRKRTRSRSPYRSRSRSRTSRLRTRSRSRSRFRSRSRSRYRSRSRSFIRSSSRGRYRSFSRSPLRRRYSRSRSRSSFRRYSPTRRRSPLGSRRKSYSPSGSPGYRGRYERRWSPRHGERYNSPDRFTPSSAPTFPDYGFNRPSAPNDFYRFDGHGPPPPGSNPEYFGNQGRYVPPLVPPPPLLPGVPVGPPTGYQGFQGPPPPSILPGQSRSPKHISRPRDASPHGRYGYSRRYDRKDKYDRTNPSSDRYLDKSKYSRDDRDGHGRKDSIRTQDKDVSHDKDRNQMSDSGKSKSTRDKKHKDNRENGKNDDGSEKIDGRSKRKKESKKRDKSEKKKRDKSKDKKKTETETSKENADSEGKEHKQKIDADTTKVPLSVGNTFTRNANSTLIFLTGGGEETSAAKETSKTITQSTPSTPPGGDISKTDRILKADKATDVTESKKVKKVRKKVKENPDDTSDSNTEKNKSKTKSRKKTLVEYNETSGDTSDKLSKRKISKKAKKDKTKSSNEDAQIEESKVSKVEKKGEKDDMKENMTDSSMKTELINTETNLVNRAPPSPHDVVPSSPMDTTDGIHEDEPSPPGVGTDKSEVLQEKTDLSDDKPQLMFDLPELSKWERDDFDDEGPEQMEPQKTEIKKSLPKSVIEKAEKALTQKIPKISSIASAITSPPQIQLKKRRVYLDDEKPSEKKTVEQSEDDRRVHTKQKSMQITISSKEKQRSEENEKRERQNEKSRSGNRRDRVDSEEKREREPERKSVFSRMKMDDSDQNRDKKSREDSSSQNIRDLREKLPSRTDRRDHDKYDKDRERHESRERYDKDRQRQDKDYDRKDHPRQEKESSYKHKESSNKNDTQRSMDSRELSELRENRKPKFDKDLRKPDRGDSKDKGSSERKISASEEKPDKKSKPVIDRKESILDESLFEPDYNEDLSESDSSSIEPSTTKDKEASLSFSSRDNSTSPKKRKRQDTTDDENQSKKSKHKKHKHKSGKHKHKKKKHRKSKDEVEK